MRWNSLYHSIKGARFERADQIIALCLLTIIVKLLVFVLRQIIAPSIDVGWLFSLDPLPSISPQLTMRLHEECWGVLVVAALIYIVFGPQFRRYLQKRFPNHWNFLQLFLKHFNPISWIDLLLQDKRTFPKCLHLPLTATFPSTLADKKMANKLYKEWHGDDTPKYSIIKRWHQKNPLTEGKVTDNNGDYVGFFDIFPVGESFVEELKNGRVDEFQLINHLIGDRGNGNSWRTAEHIYVGGIVKAKMDVDESSHRAHATELGIFVCNALVMSLQYLIEKRGRCKVPIVYAVAFENMGLRFCNIVFDHDIQGWVSIDKKVPAKLPTGKDVQLSEINRLREQGIFPWFSGTISTALLKKLRSNLYASLPGSTSLVKTENSVAVTWNT